MHMDWRLSVPVCLKPEGSKARNAIRVSTMDERGTVAITGH